MHVTATFSPRYHDVSLSQTLHRKLVCTHMPKLTGEEGHLSAYGFGLVSESHFPRSSLLRGQPPTPPHSPGGGDKALSWGYLVTELGELPVLGCFSSHLQGHPGEDIEGWCCPTLLGTDLPLGPMSGSTPCRPWVRAKMHSHQRSGGCCYGRV